MAVFFDSDTECAEPDKLRQSCEDAHLPTGWWGMPNQFRVPCGRGPGRGWILLRKEQWDELNLAVDHTLTFFDQINQPRVLRKITALRAQCLVPNLADDAGAVYLCDVVDRRWFLSKIPCDVAFNVVCTDGSSYVTNTLNGSSVWSWQQVVQNLATTLGIGTLTLPFTPHGTPENLVYYGSWAWESLNNVLDRIACTIRYDIEADTFSVIRLGVTSTTVATAGSTLQSTLAQNGLKTWDSFWQEPNRGKLPEKIRVLFSRRPKPTDGSSPWYAKDITLTAATGVESGTFEQLVDDMTALGATGTPTNSSALTTRAQERADDWLRKRLYAESRATISYRDFQAGSTLLTETTQTVVYDDRGGASRTEIASGPDGAMESWRPYDRPLLLGDCITSASGSGSGSNTGSNTGTATASNSQSNSQSQSNSLSGSGSGSGSTSSACIVQAIKETRCIQGINRVTRGYLSASTVNGLLCLTWSSLTTTSEGCCVCPDSASGSGSATGSNSSTSSSGGGSTFVTCCVDPVPNTLYATFGGDLAFLGSRAVIYVGYFAGLGHIWESDCFDSGCYGSGGPGNGGLVRAWVACRDSGTWEAGAVQTSVRGGAYQCELTVNTVSVTMTPLTGTCSPINLSGSGTSSPAATNPACASKTGTVVVTQ